MSTGDKPLYGFVVTQVAQVAKNRHEAFRLKRLAVNVNFCSGNGRVIDAPLGDLIREEGSDDIENARDDVVILHDMQSSRWNCE